MRGLYFCFRKKETDMMRTLVIGLSIGLLTTSVQAQEQPAEWTLRSCLDYALANNIQIKKSRVNELSGLEDRKSVV